MLFCALWVQWNLTTGTGLYTQAPTLSYDEQVVYVPNDGGFLFAVNVTFGKVLWNVTFAENTVLTSVAVSTDGTLYFGSGGPQTVYAYYPTGAQRVRAFSLSAAHSVCLTCKHTRFFLCSGHVPSLRLCLAAPLWVSARLRTTLVVFHASKPPVSLPVPCLLCRSRQHPVRGHRRQRPALHQ